MSVINPVDKKVMTANIDHKLHFYGVVKALGELHIPMNEQINCFLQYCTQHSLIDPDKLSLDGRHLMWDICNILETACLIVQQKNTDKLFQNFIWHIHATDLDQRQTKNLNTLSSGLRDDGCPRKQEMTAIYSSLLYYCSVCNSMPHSPNVPSL